MCREGSSHLLTQPKSPEQQERIIKRLLAKEEAKREKLASLGIDYDFEGYSNAGESRKARVTAIKNAKEVGESTGEKKAEQKEILAELDAGIAKGKKSKSVEKSSQPTKKTSVASVKKSESPKEAKLKKSKRKATS